LQTYLEEYEETMFRKLVRNKKGIDTILASPIPEEHGRHPDQSRKLLREKLELQPVREDHLDRPALDNPDNARTGPASDIFSLQLHQYWRRVHVLDRKLLHNNTPVLSRQHILVLRSKILLIRAR
jgi:hypothetical protein